jgi:hypothetical protein
MDRGRGIRERNSCRFVAAAMTLTDELIAESVRTSGRGDQLMGMLLRTHGHQAVPPALARLSALLEGDRILTAVRAGSAPPPARTAIG